MFTAKAGIQFLFGGLDLLDAGSSPAWRENFGLSRSWLLEGKLYLKFSSLPRYFRTWNRRLHSWKWKALK